MYLPPDSGFWDKKETKAQPKKDWNPARDKYKWGNLSFSSSSPLVLNFKCDPYQKTMDKRTGAGKGKLANITLPVANIKSEAVALYTTATTETGGIWDSWGPWLSWVSSGQPVSNVVGDIVGWNAMQAEMPIDLRDAAYRGHSLRDHQYSWTLIPKDAAEGELIATIAKAFQTLSYPQVSDDSTYSRVIRPPVWDIAVWDLGEGKTSLRTDWSNDPLKCVLQAVNIQTAGVAGGVYVAAGGYPAATKISVAFKELEGCINIGQNIASRSDVRMMNTNFDASNTEMTSGGFLDF
jgi:hypothetical protein